MYRVGRRAQDRSALNHGQLDQYVGLPTELISPLLLFFSIVSRSKGQELNKRSCIRIWLLPSLEKKEGLGPG